MGGRKGGREGGRKKRDKATERDEGRYMYTERIKQIIEQMKGVTDE